MCASSAARGGRTLSPERMRVLAEWHDSRPLRSLHFDGSAALVCIQRLFPSQ